MNNYLLTGVRHFDNFNLRICVMVVGLYAVITILSYFVELARAGLIFHSQPHPLQYSIVRQMQQQPGQSGPAQEQVDLNIGDIKEVIKESKELGGKNKNQQINIAVNLGKNHSYKEVNNSEIRVYHHKNTLPNFFSSITLNTSKYINNGETNLSSLFEILGDVTLKKRKYLQASQVLFYQHEPGGYASRECLKSIAVANNISIGPPLTAEFRKDWEVLPKGKKGTFHFLYGGLSFGACESISHPCTYFAMLRHPLDRIITVYFICKNDPSSPYCKFANLNVTGLPLKEFIKSQGSSLFQKLLYYSRHCKPVGEDEICIQDTKTSFVLSADERKVYLSHVLDNLDKWFSVVGIVDHISDSLVLFEEVLGHKFSQCLHYQVGQVHLQMLEKTGDKLLPYVVESLKKSLLKDAEITRILYADLMIYDRFLKIFKAQVNTYLNLRSLRKRLEIEYGRLDAQEGSKPLLEKKMKRKKKKTR